ncbi:MAG: hypothetical protein H0X28_05670 [Solirubrobacterales bacterium]|nr:hypothetical protein [Solirubrobacterales bacterium]
MIEDARRRQRHRRRRGVALGGAALVIGLLAVLIGGGGDSQTPSVRSSGDLSKLTLVHGRAFLGGHPALMGVTPSLQAGNVGVCVRVVDVGDCNGPFPTIADPVYGGEGGFSPKEKVGPEGEIDAIFTGPGVASMRVAHLGTFKAESAPGLPPGAKQIAFYRPPGSRGTVIAPGLTPRALQTGFKNAHYGPALTETLLDGSGHAIPVTLSHVFTLPNSYWQGSQTPPAKGRCAISSTLAGVSTAWGEVADKIAADPSITTPGWLTCLNVWFSAAGESYDAAVLLNARSPGKPPAMLWGAIPVPGHPGMVEIPPVQREVHYLFPRPSRAQAARELARNTKTVGRARAEQLMRQVKELAGKEQTSWDVFVPSTVARRVGPTWVLVRYGNSLAQRISLLESLRVTKLKLRD